MKIKIGGVSIFCLLMLLGFQQPILGISENFKFIIDTIGVPQFNVLGDAINEEVYETYHVFVYANPVDMYHRSPSQRFKAVPGNGKWTENGGPYQGFGTQGEYDILGVGYSGNFISNVFFPVDAVPETTPDHWDFVEVEGAYESWIEAQHNTTPEQLQYMKETNILFDRIDYGTNTSDSYHLVEYPLSANTIGLHKAKLNTASTWKTNGVISVKRRNHKGQIRYATFSTKPMAAQAEVVSYLEVPAVNPLEAGKGGYLMISFGVDAINLNQYAKVEHIREIGAKLYVNGKEYASVTDTKVDNVRKHITIPLAAIDYPEAGDYPLPIQIKSYLATEFYVDGLLQHEITQNPIIRVEKEKDIVPVKNIKVGILEKREGELKVFPLMEMAVTKQENSSGMIESGRHLTLALRPEEGSLQDIHIKWDGKEISYETRRESQTESMLSFCIPKDTNDTLASWEFQRNATQNYFQMDFNSIGKRVASPHEVTIEYQLEGKLFHETLRVDTMGVVDQNMNYLLEGKVTNQSQREEGIPLDVW